MVDTDYVEPLTGEEIIIDACAQLAEHLRRDCNLRETDSYEGGYSATIKTGSNGIAASLQLHGMDTITVDATVAMAGLPATELDIPVEPALNVVRERSEQPVPTATTLENGEQAIRPRRYVRSQRMGGATGESL